MKVINLKNKCDLKDVFNIKPEKKTEDLPLISEPKNSEPKNSIKHVEDFDFSFITKSIEPILSPEEIKEKRKIIIHIKNYIREFPNSLMDFKNIDYNSKNISELLNYLEEIKLTVCNSNSGGLLLGVFQGACDILETSAPIVNFDLTGLHQIAIKNPAVVNSVKELSLEYQNLNYIPPEKRLFMLMFKTCYALNSFNKSNKKIINKLNENIPDNIAEKYIEL